MLRMTANADPRASLPGTVASGRLRRAVGRVREDLDAAIARDPAAESRLDVAVNSPGLHAIWAFRLAHHLWLAGGLGKPAARILMTLVRAVTGVEIHPGAGAFCLYGTDWRPEPAQIQRAGSLNMAS
jgi:serine O-acetyltransferase